MLQCLPHLHPLPLVHVYFTAINQFFNVSIIYKRIFKLKANPLFSKRIIHLVWIVQSGIVNCMISVFNFVHQLFIYLYHNPFGMPLW